MGATDPTQGGMVSGPAQTVAAEAKGKGKADPQDVSMGEEDSSSDEETGAEDDVSCTFLPYIPNPLPSLQSNGGRCVVLGRI